jgi:transposase InsO family protein
MEDKLNDEGERRLNVSGVLRVLGVSRNGYYSFRKRLPSDRQKRKEAIMEKIMAIYNESHQNYGAPKITMVLQSEGEKISEKTVGNYMRELGIRAQYVKPYTVTTIDSDFSIELKNILDEEFNPSEPNAVWCSDITYIWTYEGFVYLTSIMDLFSRKIIAWELSTTLEAKWVVETINRAKKARRIDKPLVMHSDRGIQYTCSAYMEATEGFINSYSK